ncbi:hypothetical protein TNCV_3198331 [Trichonephila clavipes]|nr:hypothetical protein TNCV_3198331 [Trichonephila clavipes]
MKWLLWNFHARGVLHSCWTSGASGRGLKAWNLASERFFGERRSVRRESLPIGCWEILVPNPKRHIGKNFDAAGCARLASRRNEDPDVGLEREAIRHYISNIRQSYESFLNLNSESCSPPLDTAEIYFW